MQPSKPRDVVLVTGESRVGLACARSLAASRIPFVVLSSERGVVAASRTVDEHVVGPSPPDDDGFMELLSETIERTGARVVLPAYDLALQLLDRRRDTLAALGATLAAAPPTAVRNVLDKRENLATARRLGIPCPAQFELDDVGQIPQLVEALGFPIVLKPRESGGYGAHGFRFKWLVAHDEAELRALIAEHCRDGHFPLFQELARGHLIDLYCFAVAGDVVGVISTRTTRRVLGENVFREVIAVPDVLRRHAEAMLGELAWDGTAGLSFFVSPQGEIRYMETNGRPWASIAHQVAVGWDFPVWAVRYHGDGVIPTPPPPRVGSKATWPFGDLMSLVVVARGQAWRTDREEASLARATLDYVSSFRPGVRADVVSLRDPLPGLVEHWEWIREVGSRRLPRTVRGRPRG